MSSGPSNRIIQLPFELFMTLNLVYPSLYVPKESALMEKRRTVEYHLTNLEPFYNRGLFNS